MNLKSSFDTFLPVSSQGHVVPYLGKMTCEHVSLIFRILDNENVLLFRHAVNPQTGEYYGEEIYADQDGKSPTTARVFA